MKAASVGHQQNPALYDQTDGDFYFQTAPANQTEANRSAPGGMQSDRESILWQSAEKDNTVSGYEWYLNKYPQGDYAPLARNRLDKLKEKSAVSAAASVDDNVTVRRVPVSPPETLTGMEFVHIPGGCFKMRGGAGIGKNRSAQDVCLDGFEMGKYQVTQEQWRKIMKNNPSFNACGDKCPVEQVSWNDIEEFLKKLNMDRNSKYRLPTEAEWEYACRNRGKTETYCRGFDLKIWSKDVFHPTRPVGQKDANELGLYDMSGSVWEWVADWINKNDAKPSHTNSQESSEGFYRVKPSGDREIPAYMHSVDQNGYDPEYRSFDIGFRVVRTKR
ncbi:MAG: formylglycine-generating enzyme family protein [Magnetococcales bacterium]|nr:formylglycine-generating enzyme family protein [Magnetococcales bacterium]